MESLSEILKRYGLEGKPRAAAATSSSGGPPEDAAYPPDCPVCGGIGWVRRDLPVDAPDFGKLLPCECRLRRFDAERFARLERLSNLGALAGVTLEALAQDSAHQAPEVARAVEAASAFARAPSGWLVIAGPPGSGKTRLAAAVANECMKLGTPVFFTTVADLLDRLRIAYAPSSETPYDEFFELVRSVPVLFLDDLGAQSATPWAQEKLVQILGHRHNSRLPTVVTTDVPLDALDDRIRPRLQDPGLARLVQLGSPGAGSGRSLDSLDVGDVAHMTFETFDPVGGMVGPRAEALREAWRLAKSYAEAPDGWLVFVGGYGCGKTHLAAAIAHHRRKLGDEVLFVQVPDLLDKLRSSFHRDGDPLYEVADRVKRVRLLILDDFSEPIDTPWAREKLYQVLNFRHLTRLPTVITSSLSLEAVKAVEPRIWSRITDMRFSTVYEIVAPDYRTGVWHNARGAPSADRPSGRSRRGAPPPG